MRYLYIFAPRTFNLVKTCFQHLVWHSYSFSVFSSEILIFLWQNTGKTNGNANKNKLSIFTYQDVVMYNFKSFWGLFEMFPPVKKFQSLQKHCMKVYTNIIFNSFIYLQPWLIFYLSNSSQIFTVTSWMRMNCFLIYYWSV